MKRTFLKNVLPAMLAFAFSGMYAIVDGFFVGQNVGDAGLAAINIAYPLTAVLQAAGTGIGMGGAIHLSISAGGGDRKKADRYFGNTFTLLLISCLVLMAVLGISYGPVLRAFGAEGDILLMAEEYTRIILVGTFFQVLSTGLVPVLRNYNKAFFVMVCMVAGFMTNIILDYLFVAVFYYGIAGAAWATIIGQAVTAVPCVVVLLSRKYRVKKEDYLLKKEQVKEILLTALSPFGLTLSPNIVIIILNKACAVYGGALAVSAYAVVSYVVCVIQLLLQGVGDGSQPLISRYLGEGNLRSANAICKMAYLMAELVAVCCIGLVLLLAEQFPVFFGASPEVAEMAAKALPIFAAGFLFVAFVRVTTSYFYATKQNTFAYIMVYGEAIILALLLAFTLPHLFGVTGIWISVPAEQLLLAAVGVCLLVRMRKQYKEA